MRNSFFCIVVLLISIQFAVASAFGQSKRISVNVKDIPLNQFLNQLSAQHQIRFAFDDDLLSKQKVSISVSNTPIESVLETVLSKNGFGFKVIGGTYVVVKQAQPPVSKPLSRKPKPVIQKTDTIKAVPIPPPSVPSKLIVKEKPVCEKIVSQISGYVTDAITGERLKHSQMLIDGNIELETNEMGFFFIKEVLGTPLKISVLHLGYKRLDTLIAPGINVRADLVLSPLSVILAPIMVNQKENYLIEMPNEAGLIAFNPVSSIHMPKLESNDLINALTLIPGIDFIGGPNPGLSIRGGAPTENLVLLDGIPVLETSHLFGNMSVLNSKFIQQAFVSRGGFGAEYGGRTSGIIDMTGKNGAGTKPTIDLNANLLHVNGYVGLPIGDKVSFSGAFRQSFVHIWPNYLFNKLAVDNVGLTTDLASVEGIVSEPEIIYRDINGKISYRPNQKNEITINYLNGSDTQFRNYQFPTDGKYFQVYKTKANTNGYSVRWGYQTTKSWMNSISVGYSEMADTARLDYGKEPNKNEKGGFTQIDFDRNNLSEMLIDWKSEIKLKQWTHQFGGGFTQNGLRYKFLHFEKKTQGRQKSLADSISLDHELMVANAYYQGQVNLFEKVNLKAGIRFDHNLLLNESYLLPRLSLEYKPNDVMKFNYAFGRYAQYLYRTNRINSENQFNSTWSLAKADDEIIRSGQHIVGMKMEKAGWLVNLEAYTKHLDGQVVYLANKINDKGFEYTVYESAISKGIQSGIDLFVQYRQGMFHHLLSYSLSKSDESIPGFNNNDYFPAANDQRHRLRLTEMVNYRNWVASANWYFATGSPFFTEDSNRSNLQYDRLTNFSQVDVSVVRQFRTNHLLAEAGVTLLNIFNRENLLATDYFNLTGDNTDLSVKSEITALSFTPVFFINLKY